MRSQLSINRIADLCIEIHSSWFEKQPTIGLDLKVSDNFTMGFDPLFGNQRWLGFLSDEFNFSSFVGTYVDVMKSRQISVYF